MLKKKTGSVVKKQSLKPLKTVRASQWDMALGLGSKPFPLLTSLFELTAHNYLTKSSWLNLNDILNSLDLIFLF